ncbi:MAG: hypothetical protein JSV86_17560 [Gemmatimonadota bacterium]|nr:MAG: hypothetical protein JSV86_17560 [Gemmatimonadota bacterium]
MSLIEFGILAVVAAACAALGQFISGYSRGGCPVSFIVAFLGAFLGPGVAAKLGIHEPLVVPLGPARLNLVSSVAGALILVVLVNLITRKRKF